MDNSSSQWIRQALMLAKRALPHDVPVGACIVQSDGTLLGQGWNTREVGHDPTGHAELMALRQAARTLGNWRLTDATLYVTLEPCPMCASALLQARIGAIVYGAPDPVQGALGSALNLATLYAPVTPVHGGILETECRDQLQAFFQERRAHA